MYIYLSLIETSVLNSVSHVTEEIICIGHVLGPHSWFNLVWNGKYFSHFWRYMTWIVNKSIVQSWIISLFKLHNKILIHVYQRQQCIDLNKTFRNKEDALPTSLFGWEMRSHGTLWSQTFFLETKQASQSHEPTIKNKISIANALVERSWKEKENQTNFIGNGHRKWAGYLSAAHSLTSDWQLHLRVRMACRPLMSTWFQYLANIRNITPTECSAIYEVARQVTVTIYR